ncbi:MAG TPA: 3,4-dihydroxy-2-butanone-4-phosphate synthase [Beijerinckiaceae bacterium]|jgi:3,4-dihydroxy 2-butanone 4-phosphate synthase/GTP cyclohydrolase II|nr:3,4-dihydroxy-2-butanone-4-phosphate synthase [Beijerinckiaceae bacterium]
MVRFDEPRRNDGMMSHPYSDCLSKIEDVVEDARQGRMFILVDDEGRENEGDLVVPGEKATPEVINFMAKHGRGLICLSLTRKRVDELGLHLMTPRNQAQHQTAFTVSIEAREGVTTGISAADRARTIAVAIDPSKDRRDIVSPGHVFPLVAQDGGVLVRAGHTEAAVDVSRLAGLDASGVICEIMNDDGTMARMPDLVKFAQYHGLKIATIADLIAYRRRNEKLVEKIAETKLESRYGGAFDLLVYANKVSYAEHIVLVRGDLSGDDPVLVRMHQLNLLADSLGDMAAGTFFGGEMRARAGELQASMQLIAQADRGVVIIIREPAPTSLSRVVREREGHAMKKPIAELRQYGIGAQILLDLGVRNMILLSNSQRNIVGLNGYGINLVAQRPIPSDLPPAP